LPDLSGPDIGELVVSGAAMAHGLAMVAGRLVWLLTEGATVGSARPDGGESVVLFSSTDEETFGGSLAVSETTVWWSVDTEGDAPETIYSAAANELSARIDSPTLVTTGSSPDHLCAGAGTLFWADLGRVWRFDGTAPVSVAQRDKRIVSMAADPTAMFWLEVPYEGIGDHVLVEVRASGAVHERARLTTSKSAPTERDALTVVGGTPVWAESQGDEHALWAHEGDAAEPRRLVSTGLVTAMIARDGELLWAEAHGDGEQPTSILRGVTLTSAPRRLGRVRGHVTALVADATHLYWSGATGILRTPLR
jgi:hypothetical protein